MIRALLLSGMFALPCLGQMTGAAKTSGPCSPAVSGINNRITIECEGITKEQADQLLELLNKVASKQLDPKQVADRLEDISARLTAEIDRVILALTGRLPQHLKVNVTESLNPSTDMVTTQTSPGSPQTPNSDVDRRQDSGRVPLP